MTSTELATLSTLLWLVGTVSLFILLAEWSGGGSWGLASSIVQGVRGWSGRNGPAASASSGSNEPLRPMLDPYALLRRDQGPEPPPYVDVVDVEVIEHWERPIARR